VSWTYGKLRERANHPGGSLSPHAGLAHLGPASSSHAAALTARRVGEPQQEIAVAGARRAKAHEIASAQLIERTQQMVLVRQPSLVLGDDGRAVAIAADPERITPFAAAPDVDGAWRNARAMLVENPAHFPLSPDLRVASDWQRGAVEHRLSREALPPQRERLAR
jgi:hypothetical protein